MVLSNRVVVMRAGVIQQIGTPREIYQQPANQFVADFIGTANFLEVEVTEQGTFLVDGPRRPLPVGKPGNRRRGRMKLMVRPEAVQFGRRAGAMEAKVEQKMFLGDATVYLLRIHGQLLKAKSQQREEFRLEETVFVDIAGEHYFEQ